jgi:hypothetical protein
MGNMREEAERLIRQVQQQAQQEEETVRQQKDFQEQQAKQAREAELQRRQQDIETWKKVSQRVNQAVLDSNAVASLKELQRDLWQGKGKIYTRLATVNPYTSKNLWDDDRQHAGKYKDKEYPPEMWLNINTDGSTYGAVVGDHGLYPPLYNSASVGLHFERGIWTYTATYEGANSPHQVGGSYGREKIRADLEMRFSEDTMGSSIIQISYNASDPSGKLIHSHNNPYTYSCEPIDYDLANIQSARRKISEQLVKLHVDAFTHNTTPPQLQAKQGRRR